jgi:RNA-binding protein 39
MASKGARSGAPRGRTASRSPPARTSRSRSPTLRSDSRDREPRRRDDSRSGPRLSLERRLDPPSRHSEDRRSERGSSRTSDRRDRRDYDRRDDGGRGERYGSRGYERPPPPRGGYYDREPPPHARGPSGGRGYYDRDPYARPRDDYRGGGGGRPLSPRRPPPRREQRMKTPEADDYERRSIFCSQLANKLGQRDLGEFFEEHLGEGTVKDVRIVQDRITGRSKG